MSGTGDAPFADAARAAMGTVIAALPAAGVEQALALGARMQVVAPAGGVSPSPVSTVLQRAIAEGQVLAVDYQDRDGAASRREIEPVAFVSAAERWYVVAWCRLRDEPRCFRLDRVQRALATGEHTPKRCGPPGRQGA